jgi:chromate transporter
MSSIEPTLPRLSLLQLFLKFLRFGCLAFGGPVAQIAMIRHTLVDQETVQPTAGSHADSSRAGGA